MKILFVCKSLPPKVTGGIQTHTLKLSEWLVRMGHEVSMLTAGNWRGGIRQKQLEGRTIIEIPYFPGRKLPFCSLLAEEWSFNHAALRWLRSNHKNYDIVHIQGRSGFGFAGKQGTTPLVATFHGFISIENECSGRHLNPGIGTMLHEKLGSFLEKSTLQQADACIAVSREMLHQMDALCPDVSARTTILPNGVDVPALTPHPNGSATLLFVGRLDRIKGIFPLVDAMHLAHPGVHLIMVGDGPSRRELERHIAATGLTERITLTGALSTAQVFDQIQAAFALVLPSFYETQGIVLLEANAGGKPVIASDIAGIREVVKHGETGWLTPAGDANSLAASINYLFENPDEAARLGRNGRIHVAEKFAWEKIALDTERLYGQVLVQKIRDNQAKKIKSPEELPRFTHTRFFSKIA